MKNYIKALVLISASLGMGIAMPSCPGQQAMQQQIDTLQTSNADLNKKVLGLSATVNSLQSDVSQIKQLLPKMSSVIQTQENALSHLTSKMKESRGAPKKRHK